MKRATFYVVLEPQRRGYDGALMSIKADRITQDRPRTLSTKHVALKLNVDVDEAIFEQFLPEATVTIRDTRDLMVPQVTVEQIDDDASDEESDGATAAA